MMLLNEVKGSFTGRDFIAEIAVIPDWRHARRPRIHGA